MALVEKSHDIRNGNVVIANIDEEKTVKRFYHRPLKKIIELVPCNPDYETIIKPEKAVHVIGKVVFSRKFFLAETWYN